VPDAVAKLAVGVVLELRPHRGLELLHGELAVGVAQAAVLRDAVEVGQGDVDPRVEVLRRSCFSLCDVRNDSLHYSIQ